MSFNDWSTEQGQMMKMVRGYTDDLINDVDSVLENLLNEAYDQGYEDAKKEYKDG